MYSLMLPNGGVGTIVAAGQPKQLVKVNGIPILVYSLVAADAVPEIDQIVLNFPDGWREQVESVVEDYAIQTPVVYVAAGSTRHDSVRRMLEVVTNDQVVIHESARPLVRTEDFSALVSSKFRNVSLMLDIPFAVAPVDPDTQTGYLERSELRNVQLPQKFSKSDLRDDHKFAEREDRTFTEDVTLVAVTGHGVHYIS